MDKNLVVRTISALVVLAIIFSLYYLFDVNGLIAFSFVVIGLGAFEFKKMVLEGHLKSSKTVSTAFYIIGLVSLFLFFKFSLFPLVFTMLFFLALAIIARHRNTEDVESVLKEISFSFTGLFYVLVFPLFILEILSVEEIGTKLFVCLLAITFSGDILAYFCGRLFGKRLIMPAISPKKTVAGSVGGLWASGLTAAWLLHWQWGFTSLPIALLTGFSCGLSAQIGDFFESLMKRVCGVKDSGNIMPGHGGILDRIDGLYFAAPIYYSFYHLLIA